MSVTFHLVCSDPGARQRERPAIYSFPASCFQRSLIGPRDFHQGVFHIVFRIWSPSTSPNEPSEIKQVPRRVCTKHYFCFLIWWFGPQLLQQPFKNLAQAQCGRWGRQQQRHRYRGFATSPWQVLHEFNSYAAFRRGWSEHLYEYLTMVDNMYVLSGTNPWDEQRETSSYPQVLQRRTIVKPNNYKHGFHAYICQRGPFIPSDVFPVVKL